MNAWDWHILKQLGLWLAVFVPIAFLLWLGYDELKRKCYWARNPYSFIKDLLFGRRYAVRVNGVWSVCRGRLSRSEYYLFIKYGKDKHKWELKQGDFDEIVKSFTDKEAQQYVIEKNVKDLKKKHPKKEDVNRRILSNRIITGRMRMVGDAFEPDPDY